MASNRTPAGVRQTLEKLTDIQADLTKIVAVHDERLNAHEKHHDTLSVSLEKRREELSIVQNNLYAELEKKTDSILTEVGKIRTESTAQHNTLANRISTFEKYIWMAIGATTVISWIIYIALNNNSLFK